MSHNTTRQLNNKILPVLFFILLARGADAQDVVVTTAATRIDSNVVWHPPSDFRKIMGRRCSALASPNFQRCFISLMTDLGASAEAVRFAALTDTTGYVRHFINTGIVDVAYVSYPFRANENFGISLVNGIPDMIDVDDFQFVDLTTLKKDSVYLDIVGRFPDASVWPGDRFAFDQPVSQSLTGGGQRFIVSYNIRNGCHACEQIGIARFAFDFDNYGKFEGTRLLDVVSLVR